MQVVEHLSRKYEVLSSNPSTEEMKGRKERKERRKERKKGKTGRKTN
jgi:hypothetical protein